MKDMTYLSLLEEALAVVVTEPMMKPSLVGRKNHDMIIEGFEIQRNLIITLVNKFGIGK